MNVSGRIVFGIPGKLMVGEVTVTKDSKGIGKLAVIAHKDPINELLTFGFLDKSEAGVKPNTSFLSCYIETEQNFHYVVEMNEQNFPALLDAYEKKKQVNGSLEMKHDQSTFEYYYVAVVSNI